MARNDPEQYRAGDPDWANVTGSSGIDRLDAYVKQLNNSGWIAESGKPYFVAKRQKPDGSIEHFVDRHI